MDPHAVGAALIAKLSGGALGTVLSFLRMPPRGRRDAASRATVAMISAGIGAQQVQVRLGFSADFDGLMVAGAVCAFASWWVLGAAIRVIERWTPK